ncbi:hypothetical protein NLJ89_g2379 [Agrocybe chaxingu]|uniref:NADP-dependent oxidoreductase domain-containing protein n=1 Tax=Agrocybe chaxingu TaxID=84603 RepID=A0A9W8MXP5_9AGAR|nr:hypothetical protein NLJ89_g2379 [Agrocybe chaxingu]
MGNISQKKLEARWKRAWWRLGGVVCSRQVGQDEELIIGPWPNEFGEGCQLMFKKIFCRAASALHLDGHHPPAPTSEEHKMTVRSTVKVGNTTLAKIGHGLMTMTWVPTQVPDDIAFEAIKTSLDAVPAGVKMLLNAAEFYGEPHDFTANLDLVARFFEKYPSYADKAFLSGGTKENAYVPDNSLENLRRSVDNCLKHLRGTKKIDLFEPCRIDNKYPVEDQIRALTVLQKEGKFDYIGLSECSAASLRKAQAVAPITMVEIEVSPIAYEEETKKGIGYILIADKLFLKPYFAVIATCAEFGIIIEAYSPMGKGLLTGALTKLEDLPAGDHRSRFSRFTPENFEYNSKIVDAFNSIAATKGVTPAQLSIAWVSSKGPHIIPLPGSSKKSRTEENLAACDIKLTEAEIAQIDAAVAATPVKGGRAVDGLESVFMLWG